jgi:hypothetical protein
MNKMQRKMKFYYLYVMCFNETQGTTDLLVINFVTNIHVCTAVFGHKSSEKKINLCLQ